MDSCLTEDAATVDLARALASAYTPDELDKLAMHLAAAVDDADADADTIAPVLTRLLDATGTGRELHAAILADGAHAAGCHATPHADDCGCWCHMPREKFDDAPARSDGPGSERAGCERCRYLPPELARLLGVQSSPCSCTGRCGYVGCGVAVVEPLDHL